MAMQDGSPTGIIALLAPDRLVPDLLALAYQHRTLLSRYNLAALESAVPSLQKTLQQTLRSIRLEDLEADLRRGGLAAVICLLDRAQPPDALPDIATLLRLCSEFNLPFAFNLATAHSVLNALGQTRIAHLIFNPVAGHGDATQELLTIRQTLAPAMQLQIHFTTPETDADVLAEQAIARSPDLIIASGGDGTVSLVASKVIGTGIPLGIIPRGTANALSVALGIPTGTKQACDLILAGTTRTLDAAYCNQHMMILLAGIGFEAGMVSRATRELKNQWGVLAYLIAGWQQLGEQTPFETELEVDGTVYRFQASALTIANAAPPTSVLAQGIGEVAFDDGALDVTIITNSDMPQPTIQSRLESTRYLMRMFGSALAKTKADLPNLYHFRAKRLTIATAPAETIVVDGEIIGTTPLQIECLPGAFTVCAPAKTVPSFVETLAAFWVRRVSPSLAGLMTTVGVGGIVGSAIALFGLWEVFTRVLAPQTATVDIRLLQLLRHSPNPIVDGLMRTVTLLADPSLAIVVTVLFAVWLLNQKMRRETYLFLLACLGAILLNNLLRLGFNKIRPNLSEISLPEAAFNFPSGHGLGGMVLYGMIAYLLGERFPARRRSIYTIAIVTVLAIGISRLYLGLQLPSDVLAGWSVGFLWLTVCIVLLRLQDVRKQAQQQRQALTIASRDLLPTVPSSPKRRDRGSHS